MTATVTLLTDRNAFHDTWRAALEAAGLSVNTLSPDALGSLTAAQPAIIIDAAAVGLDEDGLLEAVGFALACRSVPCVDASGSEAPVDDVVDEMCRGLIARSATDVPRLAQSLARRLDDLRQNKFEFVTISPRESEVLAILGDGGSVLLKRPLSPEDDGSDVESIDLEDNATRAMLGLASGITLALEARRVGPRGTLTDDTPMDGARLGARLRSLRLEAGLTQAELARRTGIHRPNIARVEAGRHTPSLETLARLAQAIGVSTSHVLVEE
jgi:DNA-binding XRE family transcriptional regulator